MARASARSALKRQVHALHERHPLPCRRYRRLPHQSIRWIATAPSSRNNGKLRPRKVPTPAAVPETIAVLAAPLPQFARASHLRNCQSCEVHRPHRMDDGRAARRCGQSLRRYAPRARLPSEINPRSNGTPHGAWLPSCSDGSGVVWPVCDLPGAASSFSDLMLCHGEHLLRLRASRSNVTVPTDHGCHFHGYARATARVGVPRL
jgi:hypothetical protein